MGNYNFRRVLPGCFLAHRLSLDKRIRCNWRRTVPMCRCGVGTSRCNITVQDYNKEKELKRSYQAVYHINGGRICQLADEELSQILLGDEGDAPLALLSTSRPYSLSSMWEGRTRSDYYTVSLEDGSRKLLASADYGRYRSFYHKASMRIGMLKQYSCWYTLSMADGKKVSVDYPCFFPRMG